MGSRREEERNEKIIRGLMKLPPNRRCINCNSLGPQYVCTNFWTFICMNCSGIHREFTHRVKSVSMAKFASQEVEALQNGGNQRAREVYLKDWDTQRQRLPDSSNADKIRQFIKQVYVDKRYAGGKNSDKPSNDVQGIRSPEEETRRASSYHSYSQSPPYDYQYEERRYGKQGAGLSRKPGSDRGLYEGKMSSIIYSPGHLSEHAYEDRFANEGSAARFSDYSVSSGGDPFRSSALSPNFQKDVGFSSPPVKPSTSSDSLDRQTSTRSLEANFRRDTDGIPRPQRTASSGSFGSLDSNTMSLKSFNSGSLVDAVSEPEQVSGPRQDKVPTFGQPTASGSPPIDLFQAPFRSESASSSVDLFQTPATFSSGSDTFHSYSTHPSSSPIQHQTPQTATSTVDFFADFPQPQSDATLEKGPTEPSSSKNEGWATFDSPQPTTSIHAAENVNHVHVPSSGGSSTEKFDLFSSFDSSMNWPLPEKSSSQEPSPSVADPWIGSLNNVNPPSVASNSQTWNAFGEASEVVPSGSTKQIGNPLTAAPPGHSASSDQYLGFEVSQDINIYGFPRPTSSIGPPDHSLPSNDVSGTLHPLSVLPLMGEASVPVGGTGSKPSNPFDLPFDNDVEHSNMFLDMGSLQAALPAESQVTSTFLGVGGPSWFSHNSAGPYTSVAPQGGLSYMAGQAAGTQIPNVATQGPVASIGGNPFA